MKVKLETERLWLKEFEHSDLEGMFALDSDPEVHRYLGNRPFQQRKQSEDIIAHVIRQYEMNGIGRWAMIEKSSGDFVGWCGIKLVKEETNGHIDYYDLGYRLLRKHWRKGYALEAAKACVDFAFDQLPITTLFACAHIDNAASNKILRGLGFQEKSQFKYDGEIHFWYELEKHQAI